MSLWTDFLGAEIRHVATPTYGAIRIAEAGRGNPKSLLLMHGVGGHLEAYAKTVNALASDFHVVAIDMVGHGLSNKPTNIAYVPATYAAQIVEVMDALGLQRAHVSGESLGGWVAGEMALRYPQRVDRVVLNTAGGIPIVTEKGWQDLKDLAALSRKNFGQQPTMETVRERMQWLMHPSNWHLLTDELVQTRLAIYSREDYQRAAPLVMAPLVRAMSDEASLPLLALERLEHQTLFLWTRDNPIHDVEAARQACARVRNGQLYVMHADSAHWPQYEAPEEFNRVIRAFLIGGCV